MAKKMETSSDARTRSLGGRILLMTLLVSLPLTACGGGGSGDKDDPTSVRSASVTTKTATRTPGAATAAATSSPDSGTSKNTPAPGPTLTADGSQSTPAVGSNLSATPPGQPPVPPPAPAPTQREYTAAEAGAQVNAASLTLSDLPAGWTILTDTSGTPDANAVSCGWLGSRTVTNLTPDPLQAYINVDTLSFLSSVTAYATKAGAIACAERAAVGFRTSGDIARSFGKLFIDPDAVIVAQVNYPQVGDSSIAGTLTGKIKVEANIIDLTVLVVVYRQGNVTGVVGSARSGDTPPFAELTPLINTVTGRLAATQ